MTGWRARLHSAVIYDEELPNRDEGLPRFVPEFVMAQLETDANLAQLPSLTARHLVVVMIETGLRSATLARWTSVRSSMTAPAGRACASITSKSAPTSLSR